MTQSFLIEKIHATISDANLKESYSSNIITPKLFPKISVITVNYNSGKYLENSILSVIQQNYQNLEYIIIDGFSTDNSISILKKYSRHITYWKSEKDKGIYDAMNKAIKNATGDWIFFLGADDKLEPNILSLVCGELIKDSFAVVFGNILYNNGDKVKSRLNSKIYLHNTLHHQSAFYNVKLFENFIYKDNLKIISDYELNLIIKTQNLNYKYIDKTIAVCNYDGSSRNISLFLKETNMIRSEYTNKIENLCFSCFLYIKAYLGLFIKSK